MDKETLTFTFDIPLGVAAREEPCPEFRDPWDVLNAYLDMWGPLFDVSPVDAWLWKMRPQKSMRKRAKFPRDVKR